jgi:hypothetical protein
MDARASEQPLSTLLLDIGNFKACICHNNNNNGNGYQLPFLHTNLIDILVNCNDQIALKNNFDNNNLMLDAKGIIMIHVKNWLHQKP